MHERAGEQLDEQLSALIDGELSESDSKKATDYLLSDSEAKAKWRRYHLIRDSLQGYRASSDQAYDVSIDLDLDQETRSDVVSIKSATKPIVEGDDARTVRDFKPWGVGLAMAAAVSAVVIFGIRFGGVNDREASPVAEVVGTSGESVAVLDSADWNSKLQSQASQWTRSGTPAVSAKQERLNALLVRHGEHVSLSGMNGLSGYARFVSFDERKL